MKIFNVVWEERMSINVQAETEENAIEMVHECNYDEQQISSEISGMPEAIEIEMDIA